MTNKTKKVLSILASTAILAGFTADVALNSNPTTVNAAKHTKKKTKKKKTSKQTPTSGTKPQSKYSSLGAWYLANDKYLYGRYHGQGYFADGNNDGGTDWGNIPTISAEKVDNGYYMEGWVIAYINGHQNTPTDSELYGATADNYNKAIDIYNSGKSFIKSTISSGNPNHLVRAVYDKNNNSWSSQNY